MLATMMVEIATRTDQTIASDLPSIASSRRGGVQLLHSKDTGVGDPKNRKLTKEPRTPGFVGSPASGPARPSVFNRRKRVQHRSTPWDANTMSARSD